MVCYVGRHFPWASRIHQPTFNAPSKQCLVAYVSPVVYIVHSKGSFEDHVAKVQAALRALRVVGFSGNPAKCKFAQREVFFLGHRVAEGKVLQGPEFDYRIAELPWFVLLLQKIH